MVASFSTVVTQGGVEMVIDALKTTDTEHGSRVVERNGIDALIRNKLLEVQDKIIKATDTDTSVCNNLLFTNDYRGWHHRV